MESQAKKEEDVPLSLKVATGAKAASAVLSTFAVLGLAPAVLVAGGLAALFYGLKRACEGE